MDNNDPKVVLRKILESIEMDTLDNEQVELLKKVVHWFNSLVPLYELLDQTEFQKWDEVFHLYFPDEEE